MLEQTFIFADIPKIFFLAILELALSADNAIVLGLFTSHLPQQLKRKALLIGLFSAFLIRGCALWGISFFIQYRWIQAFGAIYLLYISLRFLISQKKISHPFENKVGFCKVVLYIELFDLMFAIDSIFAGVAFIQSSDPSVFRSKIWIVYIGGMIGLIGVRFAGSLFGKVSESFPQMERAAHLMIGWIAVKMFVDIFPPIHGFQFSFWGVLFILFLSGFVKKK